jgi:hypothetical protein
MTTSSSPQMQQLEEEIKELKEQLKKYHLTASSEHDYDVKSHIIDKQNEMIELLIKQSEGKTPR